MKVLKKILSCVLILAMAVGITACGSKTPTAEVDSVLKELSIGKRDEVKVMVTDAVNKSIFGATEVPEGITGGLTEETEKILEEIVGKMEYEINSEKVDDEIANVSVTVKGGNISKAFMGYLGDMLTLSYTSDVLTTTPPEEYYLLVNEIFLEKLKAIEYDERTLDLTLSKEGNGWSIENDGAFFELLLGSSAK